MMNLKAIAKKIGTIEARVAARPQSIEPLPSEVAGAALAMATFADTRTGLGRFARLAAATVVREYLAATASGREFRFHLAELCRHPDESEYSEPNPAAIPELDQFLMSLGWDGKRRETTQPWVGPNKGKKTVKA